MSAETDEIQYLREELEAKQMKVNDLVMANQKLVSVNTNQAEAIKELTAERDAMQQLVDSIHYLTDPDVGSVQ